MEDNKFPAEVSISLSGGAAKGAFHLGAISVLEENNVKIKAISATSIGALIGGSLACGRNSKEIFAILKSKAFRKIFKLSLGKGYLYKVDMDAEVISSLIDRSSFSQLNMPLDIAVTNVCDANIEYHSSGTNLKEIILASCSISPLIKPVSLGNKLLADGGMIDNFPVQRLVTSPYKIIGINLYPNDYKKPSSIISWIKKIIFITWHSHNLTKIELCDIYVSSDKLNELSTFSFRDLDKAYALGRLEMKKIYTKHNKTDLTHN
ncbi:MAG: patatin-like phospholipase family protein [Helicobacteraceae bacterium]|nr:patatin-like phospholipase family protein [Candidatus Sulfurimonas ponti]MBL6972905.1 patatin-like phospholipase family protein [Sulfurimonas sp.]